MALQTAAILLALAGSGLAQLVECQGPRFPDYDACDKYVESWQGHFETPVGECKKDTCYFRDDAEGNCQVFVCYRQDNCEAISHDQAWAEYIMIKSMCEPVRAGGSLNINEHYSVSAFNDPDWTPDLRTLANWTTENEDGSVSGMINVHDLEALYEQEEEAKSAAKTKRAEDFTLMIKYEGVEKDGEREKVSAVLSPGVEQTWDFETSITVGIEMNIGMEGEFWDSFSASIGFSFSFDYTQTVRKGMSYSSGNCPKEAIVYYYPLYDYYNGYFGDNVAERHEVWIPIEHDGFVDGRFKVECLG